MSRGGKKGGSAARTAAGALVALAGVGMAVMVATAGRRPAAVTKPGGAAQGVGGPALQTDGRTVAVGMASSIPQARGYDTGAVDYTYNGAGWDFAQLGGR